MSLTETGFERKRLAEIKLQYDALVTNAFGAVNTDADSVIGQLLGIFSEALDNANEDLQDTYDSMYPFSATGTSLDGAVAYAGLTRLVATETSVIAAAYGLEGTLIPIGTLAHADIQYYTVANTTISRANALDVSISVNIVSNSATYNIFAGGLSFTYTSDASATKAEILAGLSALFNSGIFKSEVIGETFRIYSADGEQPFAITVDTKLSISSVASPVMFIATLKGAYPCPIGALVNIDTPVGGLDSIYNLSAGATGNDTETDSELRLRHSLGVRGTGSATVEAIKARMLQDVPEVTSIRIYENRTNLPNEDGITPHAFESVIMGGSDSDIANQLWLTKPAGIETHGNTSFSIVDSNGDTQPIAFSRAVNQYGWLDISVALYTEESLPSAASLAIKQACVDYANAYIGVGDDIILQRFYGAIYSNVSGLAQITIQASVTDLISDTPVYTSSNIAIGKAEIALFDISRINVSGV